MGDVARALGAGGKYEYAGPDGIRRVYTVAPLDYNRQKEFEQHLEECAWKTYRRACALLPPDEAAALRADTARDISAGVYSFGSRTVAQAMNSREHLRMLWFIMLQDNDGFHYKTACEMLDAELDAIIGKINEMTADPTKTGMATETR